MSLFSLILLAVIWLSVAAIYRALGQRHPWQLLQGDRRRIQLIRGLEEVRHGLALLYWLLSVMAVVEVVLYCQASHFAPEIAWTLLAAAAGELVTRTSMVQTRVLTALYVMIGRYGQYLKFVMPVMRSLEVVAKKVMIDQPVYRDKKELAHLVRHHYQVHRVLSEAGQQQVGALLDIERQTIASSVIPFKEATLVRADEVLGPLVLTELYDSPYNLFAVYGKRRSKPVGILDQGVAVSHASQSTKVADVMEERIVYLPHDATIAKALQTFIETSSPISVIIDDEQQPIGVLYIQDILRDLFGANEE